MAADSENCPKLLPWGHHDDMILDVTTEELDFPASNLQIHQPAWTWRSTDLGDQVIVNSEAFPELREFDGFALYNHNLTGDATIQLEVAMDDGFVDKTLDVTIDSRIPIWGLGEGGLGVVGLGGYDLTDDVFAFAVYWHASAQGHHARVTISDPNNPDGYISAGQLKWGKSWSSAVGMDWGRRGGFRDDTPLTRTRGGALRGAPRTPYRAISISHSWLTEEEVYDLEHIFNKVGKRGSVVLSVYPGENTPRERLFTILGRLVTWSPTEQLPQRTNRTQFTVEELR